MKIHTSMPTPSLSGSLDYDKIKSSIFPVVVVRPLRSGLSIALNSVRLVL